MTIGSARGRLRAWASRLDADRRTFPALLGLFVFVLAVFAIVPVLHSVRGTSIKDYELWHQTGTLVLQGREIYPDQNHKFDFMYPPPCALFLAPLSLLGQTGLIAALVLVNSAAWYACIRLSVFLATNEPTRQTALLYLVPSVIVIVYVWGNFLIGQPTLVLLALLLAAFVALWKQRNVLAGFLIALAAAIKAFPVILLVYLIYRRYWIAAATLALTTAFLLLALPATIRGYALAKQDLRRWSDGMLFKYEEKGLGQRQGRSNSWKNQSIFGFANRMLRHVDYDDKYAPHQPVYANIADLRFSTVNKIIAGFALAVGSAFVLVIPSRRRRTPETDAIEFALLLLLLLMVTPLSFGYLFAWLLYPVTLILRRLLRDESSVLAVPTLAALALLACTIPMPRTAQTYGNTFFATLILFVALAVELWRLKRRVPAPAG